MTKINFAQMRALRGMKSQDWRITDSIPMECGNEYQVFTYESEPNLTGFCDVEGKIQVHWSYLIFNVYQKIAIQLAIADRT